MRRALGAESADMPQVPAVFGGAAASGQAVRLVRADPGAASAARQLFHQILPSATAARPGTARAAGPSGTARPHGCSIAT